MTLSIWQVKLCQMLLEHAIEYNYQMANEELLPKFSLPSAGMNGKLL